MARAAPEGAPRDRGGDRHGAPRGSAPIRNAEVNEALAGNAQNTSTATEVVGMVERCRSGPTRLRKLANYMVTRGFDQKTVEQMSRLCEHDAQNGGLRLSATLSQRGYLKTGVIAARAPATSWPVSIASP